MPLLLTQISVLHFHQSASMFIYILMFYVTCNGISVIYELHLCTRTRQNIQYRATATLLQPQIKQCTASNEGVGDNTTWISNDLDKVCMVPSTVIVENYSSSLMIIILIKVQTLCIDSNNFACKFTHIFSKRTK